MADSGGNEGLSVVPTEVSDLGKYAYDLADVLRNTLRSAGTEVDALTRANWQSIASASFADGWRACQSDGEKIIDALATMAKALGVTADSYSAHDNQFAAQVSSLDLPPLPNQAASPTRTSSLNLP